MFSTPAGRPASAKISPQSVPSGDRRPLGRLQHDRVAEHERRRDRAQREDQRRVPRRDRADDAHRLAQPHRHRARNVGRDHLPRRPVGRAGRLAQQARREEHLEHAEAERGAGLAGEQVDDLVAPALENVGRAQEDPLAHPGGVAAQAGNASAAASTARRASSRVPAAARTTVSPVNGSVTSKVAPPLEATHSPPTKFSASRGWRSRSLPIASSSRSFRRTVGQRMSRTGAAVAAVRGVAGGSLVDVTPLDHGLARVPAVEHRSPAGSSGEAVRCRGPRLRPEYEDASRTSRQCS